MFDECSTFELPAESFFASKQFNPSLGYSYEATIHNKSNDCSLSHQGTRYSYSAIGCFQFCEILLCNILSANELIALVYFSAQSIPIESVSTVYTVDNWNQCWVLCYCDCGVNFVCKYYDKEALKPTSNELQKGVNNFSNIISV